MPATDYRPSSGQRPAQAPGVGPGRPRSSATLAWAAAWESFFRRIPRGVVALAVRGEKNCEPARNLINRCLGRYARTHSGHPSGTKKSMRKRVIFPISPSCSGGDCSRPRARRTGGWRAHALAFVVMLFPCAVFGAQPPATSAPQAPPAPAPGSAQVEASASYIIGPGDAIQVFVWRNPELSVSVPVRPDGKVSTPLVEDMVAVGKTPSQLARDIEQRLSEYIRSPQVNIIVVNPQSSFSKITVVGQVATPGSVPYREGMTVLDVVLGSGGLAEFAAGNRAKLVRKDAGGKTKEIRVRLDDLVKKGRLKENVDVKPGDVLIVPESLF
jgi:polysaccharide biosynthesis/export protein